MTTGPDFNAVVDLARTAPSVHNTQPWLFHAVGDVLTLSRDATRRLRSLDREGRQQVISCGAALYLARLGLRLQGYDSVVEAAAQTGDDRVLARIKAIPGASATAEEIALEHAALSRHFQRGAFDNQPVSEEVTAALRDAVQGQGAWVRALATPIDQLALAVLLEHADQAELDDPEYLEELASWTNRPADSGDGVPRPAIPAIHHRASTLKLRAFAPVDEPGASAPPLDADRAPSPVEHPLAIVLGTAGDEVADWLVAGQALAALLLRAAVDGVQASPLGQVVDQPWSRRRLASELGVVGHPQFVLRVGHAFPGPPTPRRPVDDVLI